MKFRTSSSYSPRHVVMKRRRAGKNAAVALGLTGATCGGTLSALAAPSADATTPQASAKSQATLSPASATVTRYARAVTNIRTGPSTAYTVVATVPAGTKIVGVLGESGWIHITSPAALQGRYISGAVLGTTGPTPTQPTPLKPSPTPVTPPSTGGGTTTGTMLYVASNGVASYATKSTASAAVHHLVGTGFSTVLVNSSWARITSGPFQGRFVLTEDMTTTAPQAPLASSVGGTSRAAHGVQVTRWVEGFGGLAAQATIRSAATTHSTAVGTVHYGTAVTGAYVSADWFRIDSGSFAGRYVNAADLAATNNFSTVNGYKSRADLCAMPSSMQTAWEPTTARYLDCTAGRSLAEMNKAFTARFGYGLTLNEGYRDAAKQKYFYAMWGSPRAAYPGTSNHGFGTAVDLGAPVNMSSNPYAYGTSADQWLTANGKSYGWDRPDYMDRTGSNPEYWHYNYIG